MSYPFSNYPIIQSPNVGFDVTVQPITWNIAVEPTPSPSPEGNTKSPLLGGDSGVGELLPFGLLTKFPNLLDQRVKVCNVNTKI